MFWLVRLHRAVLHATLARLSVPGIGLSAHGHGFGRVGSFGGTPGRPGSAGCVGPVGGFGPPAERVGAFAGAPAPWAREISMIWTAVRPSPAAMMIANCWLPFA